LSNTFETGELHAEAGLFTEGVTDRRVVDAEGRITQQILRFVLLGCARDRCAGKEDLGRVLIIPGPLAEEAFILVTAAQLHLPLRTAERASDRRVSSKRPLLDER
jgi:hypothetical protein